MEKEQTQDSAQKERNEENTEIREMGTLDLGNGHSKHGIQLLTIIGEIEGHEAVSGNTKATKYEHLLPRLAEAEEDDKTEGVLILLNTLGGDVEAGLAIAELVAGMQKPTVSLVLGGGHSIGVPLAVAARHSFIVPSATMTIHPVRMSGLMLGVPQTMDYFERRQERITRFVASNSQISPARFHELAMNTQELVMDVGTVLDGADAVDEGLIDSLGNLSDALACLYRMIEGGEKKPKPKKKKGASKSAT